MQTKGYKNANIFKKYIGKYFTSVWLFYITLYPGSCRVANEVFLPASAQVRVEVGGLSEAAVCWLGGSGELITFSLPPPSSLFPPFFSSREMQFRFFFLFRRMFVRGTVVVIERGGSREVCWFFGSSMSKTGSKKVPKKEKLTTSTWKNLRSRSLVFSSDCIVMGPSQSVPKTVSPAFPVKCRA